MLNLAGGCLKWVVGLVGLLFCFLVVGIVVLSVVDVNLYPDASLRLTWWQKLGLPVNKKIASYFLPKAKSEEDLAGFQPQTLYWIYKDKVNLSPDQGYLCGIEGKILFADTFEWGVITEKGQEVKLDLTKRSVEYYLRNPRYDEETDEWVEEKRIVGPSYFGENDKVRVAWDCPIEDPHQMVDGQGVIGQEYLKIVPVSVSRAMTNEDD